ncbi:MAG: metallophosphoesterase [Abditibacteriota bacterium]|nr:metallophosphoesterase [Abditibacteriota bacterium]
MNSEKEPSIAELNPDFEDIMIQALRSKNAPEGNHFKTEPKPLSLFCVSDIHGGREEFARLAEFYKEYERYFDGALCLGDVVQSSWKSDFSYWRETPGHEKFMLTTGNHDTLRDHKDWTDYGVWKDKVPAAEVYDRYRKDLVAGWDVVCGRGKTYYYKDYPESKVKLIVLDCMFNPEWEKELDDEQFRWFKGLLRDALSKDFAVIISYHYQSPDFVKIDCGFSEREEKGKIEFIPLCDSRRYRQTVEDFKNGGGDFVCWLCGHLHYETLCYRKDFPNQLIRCAPAARGDFAEFTGYITRTKGGRSRDAADAAVVDRSTKTLKIIRVGANMDSYMRRRNGIVINYETFEIISEF